MACPPSANFHWLFYLLAGKTLDSMRRDGFGGGRTARFSENMGGTCAVPCINSYSIVNGSATPTQLVIWRYAVEARKEARG
jgi:hypothetical protein